jgi:hypothetical protein
MSRLFITSINANKDLPGDARLLARARLRNRANAKPKENDRRMLSITEFEEKKVHVRPLGRTKAKWSTEERWQRIVPFGSHNTMAVCEVLLDGVWIRTATVHGLHLRTVGKIKQAAYWVALAAIIAGWTARGIPWTVSGDFNKGFRWVARTLGGYGAGEGVDGTVVSRMLHVRLVEVDKWGMEKGYTDHPMVTVVVTLRMPRLRKARQRWTPSAVAA